MVIISLPLIEVIAAFLIHCFVASVIHLATMALYETLVGNTLLCIILWSLSSAVVKPYCNDVKIGVKDGVV